MPRLSINGKCLLNEVIMFYLGVISSVRNELFHNHKKSNCDLSNMQSSLPGIFPININSTSNLKNTILPSTMVLWRAYGKASYDKNDFILKENYRINPGKELKYSASLAESK